VAGRGAGSAPDEVLANAVLANAVLANEALANEALANEALAMSLCIRRMAESDLEAASPLMEQLGYALTAAELRRRYLAVMNADGHALLVGEREGHLVALLHVYARPALDKPPEAIVQALVVASNGRRGGVGKALMARAEAWARERGFTSLALSSQIARDQAHAFYKALGYDIVATSHLFRKTIREEELPIT
jgi:GNAT superfamily N-acetyltransferase